MDALKTPRKRRLVDDSTGPLALARVGEAWIPMRTEKLGRSNIFLISKTYVPPRLAFELRIDLAPDSEPLRVIASTSYLERTSAGYGVGVELSSFSTEDLQRWNQFLSKVPALTAATARSSSASGPLVSQRSNRAAVLGPALPPRLVEDLQKIGIDAELFPDAASVLEQAAVGALKMVICDMQSDDTAALALCAELRRSSRPLHTVLFINRDSAEDFERGLHAGAAMVIGRPCGQRLLLTRLLDLHHREPMADAEAGPQSVATQREDETTAETTRRGVLGKLSSWAMLGFLGARQHLGTVPTPR